MERPTKLCNCVKQLAFQTKETGHNSHFFYFPLSLKGNTLRKILLYRYFKGEYGSGMNGPLSASYSKTAQVGGKSTHIISRAQN